MVVAIGLASCRKKVSMCVSFPISRRYYASILVGKRSVPLDLSEGDTVEALRQNGEPEVLPQIAIHQIGPDGRRMPMPELLAKISGPRNGRLTITSNMDCAFSADG